MEGSNIRKASGYVYDFVEALNRSGQKGVEEEIELAQQNFMTTCNSNACLQSVLILIGFLTNTTDMSISK